jgi:uncharacterized membrane protein YkvA (DUF1232 family)
MERETRSPTRAAGSDKSGGDVAGVGDYARAVSWLAWAAVAVGVVVLVWALFVGALLAFGQREWAVAVARFVPDCIVLMQRLLRDERVPRRCQALLVVAAAYLAMPLDLVPDFIPVAGQLDDALVVGLVLRSVVRGAGEAVVRDHWPGPPEGLEIVLRWTTIASS